MYRYETHLHTYPVSACARTGVRETLEAYRDRGYDGVFLTNHFLDGNINMDRTHSYEERLNFYFNDYEQALVIGREIGLKVFLAVEITYGGTDFLVYGLDKAWFLAHPEIDTMDIRGKLELYRANGAFIIQAHPFREANYIDHIRLYPQDVDAIETLNAGRTDLANHLAAVYAEGYGFPVTAGTDNHVGDQAKRFAGMESDTPIESEADYCARVKAGTMRFFLEENGQKDA